MPHVTLYGEEASDPVEKERAYRAALEITRDHRAAILGLASLLTERREFDEARSLLERVPEDTDVRRLRAQIDLEEAVAEAPPSDPLARAAADGDWEPVLARLLEEIKSGDQDDPRQKMVDIFEVLGPEHPLTVKYRSALASALF